MRRIGRILAGVVVTGALAAGCAAAATPAATPTMAPSAVAVAVATQPPTAAPTPTPVPTPTPWPSSPGTGDQHVVGTMAVSLTKSYTTETPGPDGVTHLRGGQATGTSTANDPRITGAVTIAFNLDTYTNVGSEWATMTLKNDQGTWDGTCGGGSWDAGNRSLMSCWLTGSGAYKGYTTYFQHAALDVSAEFEGIIYPGAPPQP
jgi:hypothetical protein